jgi:hypothetical protein
MLRHAHDNSPARKPGIGEMIGLDPKRPLDKPTGLALDGQHATEPIKSKKILSNSRSARAAAQFETHNRPPSGTT